MKKILLFLSAVFMCTFAIAATETINWYVDGTVYDTTTCQTGGDITLQTAPAKRGHTFTGWAVALYEFSTLDPSVAGTNYTDNASNKTWATTFPYGLVSGKSLCSVTQGTFAVTGTPDESTGGGQYCWCKATGYTPVGQNIVYENSSSSSWVFDYDRGSASDCASNCAHGCGRRVQDYSAFRRAVFGITQ